MTNQSIDWFDWKSNMVNQWGFFGVTNKSIGEGFLTGVEIILIAHPQMHETNKNSIPGASWAMFR